MTSEALVGQLQSCYTARAKPKSLTEEKCYKTTLPRPSRSQHGGQVRVLETMEVSTSAEQRQ